MVEIGRWVLATACRELRAWDDARLPHIRMATNVSLCQVTRGNLPQLVDEVLAETGVEPSRLELELSERGALRSDPEILRQLEQHFQVEHNQPDAAWSREELVAKLQGKAGAFTTGGERIDAQLLQVCPQLKIVANMAVGFNNFDLKAMTDHGVLGTNTPDVLTETTADFGFALLMATARRVTESEHYLRAGRWNKWSYDMFSGSDVHGSTLGILGMGRIGQGVARRGAHGFGMNVIYPGEETRVAFWIILGALVATLVAMVGFFRWKRWL